ncbi:MAG: cyclic nucleotide-binding domain-containing protein [Spirochaetaceae bacterium]|jgi:CRP-like cAMP-binding protein|nr:cyclic nucleotide-binding domain-containing protein [Spirochaetaceae bacterium]
MKPEPSDLQKHALFGGIVDEQIEIIVPLMQVETFEPGAVVIAEGQQNDRIHFILEGEVEVSKRGVPLTAFREGEVFGEMEVLDIMPAEATITALSPLRVMVLSNRNLRELYRQDIKAFSLVIMNLARDLSRRLRVMNGYYTESIGQ